MCSQCKGVSYCSKAHQKEHWKCHKLTCKGSTVPSSAAAQQAEALVREKALFPEYCIEVEAEVFGEDDEQELKTIMEKANIWEDAGEPNTHLYYVAWHLGASTHCLFAPFRLLFLCCSCQ